MREALTLLFGQKLPTPVEDTLERLLVLDRFTDLCEHVRQNAGSDGFIERLLAVLNVSPVISAADLALVPKQGPVVAVANHPFGLLEGAILAAVLTTIRPDVKIMTNQLLSAVPEARRYCIFVDPFGGPKAARANQRAMRDSIAWLNQGRLLAVFPAGEVAHLSLKERAITDPEWNRNIAGLIRCTRAAVLPIYFVGANAAAFQVLGLLHARVRTALLVHELLNKSNRKVELRVGQPISPAKTIRYQDDVALIRYLRHRTFLLENRGAAGARPEIREAPACRGPAEQMAAEVNALSPDRTLMETQQFQVLYAKAPEIPRVLHELGRLREIAFRRVGEGTGQAIDLDTFDSHYWQLFVWNPVMREVVGAYRLAQADEVVKRMGVKGLYTHQLFEWKSSFLDRINPALELGRSFVRPEYQRTPAPLLLLWRGIGQFLIRNPRYRMLFGPVSISADYNQTSRQLIARFLKAYHRSPELANMVSPRHPFPEHPSVLEQELIRTTMSDIEELSALVTDIDPERKGVPVLLRQYLKLGAEVVAFNVDPKFSNALDALIVLDLQKVPQHLLQRYLGNRSKAVS